MVYDHHISNVERYLQEMKDRLRAQIVPVSTPAQAMKGSRIVITATPSRDPILYGDWIDKGTHITAMGSDNPEKQELDISVLSRADRVIADSIPQCMRLGEIHHAIEAGVMTGDEIDGELGQVIAGDISGRETEAEITVCDLTGVGVQDAAIAGLVVKKALSSDIGIQLES
jgi:ornithine cyclodeaminase